LIRVLHYLWLVSWMTSLVWRFSLIATHVLLNNFYIIAIDFSFWAVSCTLSVFAWLIRFWTLILILIVLHKINLIISKLYASSFFVADTRLNLTVWLGIQIMIYFILNGSIEESLLLVYSTIVISIIMSLEMFLADLRRILMVTRSSLIITINSLRILNIIWLSYIPLRVLNTFIMMMFGTLLILRWILNFVNFNFLFKRSFKLQTLFLRFLVFFY
jgi:hypothetical protein